MFELEINTPALLFPAVTILFLAYSNRFLTIATRIREQHALFKNTGSSVAQQQIISFRQRLRFIVAMELFAVLGIICCVFTMGFIFLGNQLIAKSLFATSIVFITLSLIASIIELLVSTRALKIELSDMEDKKS